MKRTYWKSVEGAHSQNNFWVGLQKHVITIYKVKVNSILLCRIHLQNCSTLGDDSSAAHHFLLQGKGTRE